MKDKDLLGLKLKEIMEEDSRDIGLSSELIDNIISSRKKTWRDTVHDFLNREIEIGRATSELQSQQIVSRMTSSDWK